MRQRRKRKGTEQRMNELLFSSETLRAEGSPRVYHLGTLNADTTVRGVRVRYSHAGGCSQAKFVLDGKTTLGIVMCQTYPADETAYAELSAFSGTHTVDIYPEGGLRLTEVLFTETSPYEKDDYIPVPEETIFDNGHETWVACDELGRNVKNCEDVRGRRRDRQVGIFYWTWRDAHAELEPVSMTKLLSEHPDAEYNENHPAWTVNGKKTQASWNEPLYGFYLNRDPYIIRRHAVLLANAGVDFVLFDCTNGSLLWKQSYEPLLEGFRRAREDGIRTPKIAFMLNFGPLHTTENMLRTLYQDLYKPGRYRDLWFMLDGKPMIMAYRDALPEHGDGDFDDALLSEIRGFFTFRCGQPSYGFGQTRPDMWGWLEKAPQHKFGEREDGSSEMMTVGVAQNCTADDLCTCFNTPGSFGRSYTHENGHALLDETSYKYGFNFQEQWDRALDCDPDIVFVTGWNEWIMGRWHDPWIKDPDSTRLAFVDQYDKEHSRDIEPDEHCIRDNYYLQLCSNIRRFKGAGKRPAASPEKTVRCFDDFADVLPVYHADRGTAAHRDCRGFGSTYYRNDTGRNDFVLAKTARDAENLYFYVECAEDITAPADGNWMTLLLNTDGGASGWNGFRYAVNRAPCEDGQAVLEEYTVSGWKKLSLLPMRRDGKRLMITVPRAAVGLEKSPLSFSFKWADNLPLDDIIYFYRDGDTAPLGRFAYLYQA